MFVLPQEAGKIALVTEKDPWSYQKLFDAAEVIAANMPPRSLMFLLAKNAPEAIAGYVAAINHKVACAMVDAELDGELFSALLDAYRPGFIWCPREKAEPAGYKLAFNLDEYKLLERAAKGNVPLYEELALLMTTSGSTGSPKFVRLSYGNLLANTQSIIEYLGIDAQSRAITNLPLHYVYGLSVVNTHLFAGASLVVTDKTLFQKEFWQLFKEREVTNMGGVPYTYEMLNKLRFFRMQLPSLEYLTQAGGKLDKELHEKFAAWAKEAGKKFVVMYGAAEATARMGYLPPEMSLAKSGSMGRAIPGGKFYLTEENGERLDAIDTVGELVYEGKNVMLGYALSREDLSKGDELGGVLHTGDLAKVDADGIYTVVGRKKRFLKMFGKRTNLTEVEHILRQHFGRGKSTAACGCPDTGASLRVDGAEFACGGVDDRLFVFCTDAALEGEILPFLSQKLALHPSALRVKILAAIPKNASGKTLYKELEQYYDL